MPSTLSQNLQQVVAVLAQQWQEQAAMPILDRLTSTPTHAHPTLFVITSAFVLFGSSANHHHVVHVWMLLLYSCIFEHMSVAASEEDLP